MITVSYASWTGEKREKAQRLQSMLRYAERHHTQANNPRLFEHWIKEYLAVCKCTDVFRMRTVGNRDAYLLVAWDCEHDDLLTVTVEEMKP